jgi:hypothetical protein
MQLTVRITCEDQVFDFACTSATDLKGKLLLVETQREWLRAYKRRQDEADSPWYLDEDGERLPEDELFDRSPWALAEVPGGNLKLLNRMLNLDTGEAWFNLPEQYGGEWFRWARERAGYDRPLSDGE